MMRPAGGRRAGHYSGDGQPSRPNFFLELAILLRLLKAKIHHAVVTQTDLHYHGSITIDTDLLRASGLLPNEQVLVADCENGNRFETYIIPGPAGSGVIGINGAAARLSAVGNRVIVMAFVSATPEEAEKHVARVVVCDRANRIVERLEQKSTLK
jgi:aspartate 1-decarboxylase